MADQAKTDATAGGAASGAAGSQKKIAGKYDSAEHGIESIDKAMTENFHAMQEEQAAMRQLLERALTPIGDRGSGGADQGYDRGKATDSEGDSVNPAEFLSDPGKILSARERRIQQQTRQETASLAANLVANATTVLRFQMKNPDLDEHEGIVAMFMKETDPRQPLDKRLKDSATRTRAYLKNLRKGNKDDGDGEGGEGNAGRKVSDAEFVEGAARQTGRKVEPAGGGEKEPTSDEELATEVSERKARRAANFGVGVRTKKE